MENTRGILPARMHMRERAVFAVTFLRDFSADFFDAADAANVRNAPRVPSVAPVASVSTANRARTDTAHARSLESQVESGYSIRE